jgi:hypothetical protein
MRPSGPLHDDDRAERRLVVVGEKMGEVGSASGDLAMASSTLCTEVIVVVRRAIGTLVRSRL